MRIPIRRRRWSVAVPAAALLGLGLLSAGPPAASATAAGAAGTAGAASSVPARTWGVPGGATTLVLYDTTGSYGWLGGEYATLAGNLATHFGTVTAEPVTEYQSGQLGSYTATIYLGSTYNEPLPAAFLNDALTTTRPLIWVDDNIWQLAQAGAGPAAFTAAYGWDPTQSYFALDAVSAVSYHGQTLTRSLNNNGGILGDDITDPSKVTVLASARCDAPCSTQARSSDGTTFPWAIRSGNLTYLGENPFSYVDESDRAMIFADLLFDALAPATAPRHRALVRIEDVNPLSKPADLRADADYLASQGVPFSVGVVPIYTDPNGFDNNGVPQKVTLAHAPGVVAALKYMVSKGGTLIQHGYTHQFGKIDNPYDGVTTDDFEFYRGQCSNTASPPYQFFAPCADTGYVILRGPVPGDSSSWAAGRVTAGRAMFAKAKLPVPTIWETPHYAASAADYAAIDQTYSVRYERDLFFGGQLAGQPPDYNQVFGQFFPYPVHDIYGSTVLPENLGNYVPTEQNHHPPRFVPDILASAKANLVVRDGFASFFFHSYYAVTKLAQIVQGLKALGYTFTSANAVLATS